MSPKDQNDGNEDLKAKMREALDRKKGNDRGVAHPADSKEKAHGPEVLDGGPEDAPPQGRRGRFLSRSPRRREVSHPPRPPATAVVPPRWLHVGSSGAPSVEPVR